MTPDELLKADLPGITQHGHTKERLEAGRHLLDHIKDCLPSDKVLEGYVKEFLIANEDQHEPIEMTDELVEGFIELQKMFGEGGKQHTAESLRQEMESAPPEHEDDEFVKQETGVVRNEVAIHWVNEWLKGGEARFRKNLLINIALNEERLQPLFDHINENIDQEKLKDLGKKAHNIE